MGMGSIGSPVLNLRSLSSVRLLLFLVDGRSPCPPGGVEGGPQLESGLGVGLLFTGQGDWGGDGPSPLDSKSRSRSISIPVGGYGGGVVGITFIMHEGARGGGAGCRG